MPESVGPSARDFRRFWAKVERTETCWLWTAYIAPAGYGKFGFGGRAGGMVFAHRWSYEHVGQRPLDPDLPLDHLCRVRHCVNPDHLEQVTTAENNARSAPFRSRAAFRASMIARRRPDFDERCIHGHPRSPDDYVDKRGTIHCRQCKRARQRKRGTVNA